MGRRDLKSCVIVKGTLKAKSTHTPSKRGKREGVEGGLFSVWLLTCAERRQRGGSKMVKKLVRRKKNSSRRGGRGKRKEQQQRGRNREIRSISGGDKKPGIAAKRGKETGNTGGNDR